jgi:hypothetical protein
VHRSTTSRPKLRRGKLAYLENRSLVDDDASLAAARLAAPSMMINEKAA